MLVRIGNYLHDSERDRACTFLITLGGPAKLTFLLKNQETENQQRCTGMYSRKSWGGAVDPYILTKFIKLTPEGDVDPVVSLVIFEWKDEGLIGIHPDGDPGKVSKHDPCC